MQPLISVVIPAYNGEAFLEPAIQSALGQTWPRTEVVVVDDGSTDSTAEIAAALPVKLVRQENRGVASARNRGVDEATGELLTFLDQDDLFRPEKLERQFEVLTEQPDAAIASCRMRVELETGCAMPRWIDPDMIGREVHAHHLGTMLVWRKSFERVGRFDTDYRWGNDTDWFMRAREANARLARVDEALYVYRVHDANESTRVGLAVTQDTLSAVHASIRRRREKAASD